MEPNNQYENNENGGQDVTYREIPVVTKPMGFFKRLASLFIAPIKLMENIQEYPKVLHPLFVLIILAGAMAYLSQSYTLLFTAEQVNIVTERYGSDVFNLAKTMELMQGFKLATVVSTFFTQIIMLTIMTTITAFFLLMFSKIFKGKGTFIQFFSMWFHLSILSSLGYCITYSFGGLLGTTLDVTSMAAIFMPQGNFTMPLYNLLSSITLFTIWQGILLAIGLKTINGFNYKKAIVIAIVFFAFIVVITAGMATSVIYFLDMGYDMLSKAR